MTLLSELIPDPLDPRDYIFAPDDGDKLFESPSNVQLPYRVDLRNFIERDAEAQGHNGSCHDDKTEVLTDTGWLLFKDLTGKERLASVDTSNNTLIYSGIERLVSYHYTGELLCADMLFLNFSVTPDHIMIVRKFDNKTRTLSSDYSKVRADHLGWYSGLMNRVSWGGKFCGSKEVVVLPPVKHHTDESQTRQREIDARCFMRFLGVFLADGTMIKSNNHYKIQIATGNKKGKRQFIRSTLENLGLNLCDIKDRFTFENKQIYTFLRSLDLLGVHAPNKFIPDFVFDYSGEVLKELLLGHFMCDGGDNHGTHIHYTSSKKLADDLQRAIFLSGDSAVIRSRQPRVSVLKDGREIVGKHPEYSVTAIEQRTVSIEAKKNIIRRHYDGTVYCAEVKPFHTLITRRDNKILISGNCTAAATIHAAELLDPSTELSILFNYYTSRDMQGRIPQEGSSARYALRAAQTYGLCADNVWPLDESKVNDRPPTFAYVDALSRVAGGYYRIQTELNQPNEKIITTIKYALAKGYPVLVASNIGQTIYNLQPGQAYPPLSTDGNTYIGAHEWLIVGYEKDGSFICKNSWGVDWCDKGYFLCHPNVMDTDTFDCWVLKGFNKCKTVGPNQIVYPEKPSKNEISTNITSGVLAPQAVVDYAIFYRLSAFEVEDACGWEPGTVRKAALNELSGLDWRGMIW